MTYELFEADFVIVVFIVSEDVLEYVVQLVGILV
jgi:hypothetical protein